MRAPLRGQRLCWPDDACAYQGLGGVEDRLAQRARGPAELAHGLVGPGDQHPAALALIHAQRGQLVTWSRNSRTLVRKRSCSSANNMCAEFSNTTSSAFGSRRAMSSEAPTEQVRS